MESSSNQLSVYRQFTSIAQTFANEIAITQSSKSITYKTLREEADNCAEKLRFLGVAAGDRCVICLPNSINAAVAILGIWRLNSIPVLINDKSSDTHIQHAVAKTRCKIFIGSAAICNRTLFTACCTITDIELLQRSGTTDAGIKSSKDISIFDLSSQPASVIFTSGSTGLPKGVMQSHNTLINCSSNIAGLLDLTPADNILCPIPWSFDYGFGQLLNTLLVGIPQTLPVSSNPFDVCHTIEQHQPSVLAGVPSLFANLMLGVSPIKDTSVNSIRLVTNTGSAISGKVLSLLRQKFKQARISLNYGLTETYRSTSLPIELAQSHSDSVGYAVPGARITIVRKDGTEAAKDEIGEIVHSGAGVFMGYWDNATDTAKVLKSSPLESDNSLTHQNVVFTGDLGYKNELGLLYLKGRKDRQVKSMGVRICLEEIEDCLLRHPKIREAAVTTNQHEIYGEIISAFVTINSSTSTDIKLLKSALRTYCKNELSVYTMPRDFILVETFPRTVSGKIDYFETNKLRSRPLTSSIQASLA